MLLLCKYVTEKYTEIFFLFHKLSKAQIQFKGLFISEKKDKKYALVFWSSANLLTVNEILKDEGYIEYQSRRPN